MVRRLLDELREDQNEGRIGEMKTIRNLADFVRYRGGDVTKIVPKSTPRQRRS